MTGPSQNSPRERESSGRGGLPGAAEAAGRSYPDQQTLEAEGGLDIETLQPLPSGTFLVRTEEGASYIFNRSTACKLDIPGTTTAVVSTTQGGDILFERKDGGLVRVSLVEDRVTRSQLPGVDQNAVTQLFASLPTAVAAFADLRTAAGQLSYQLQLNPATADLNDFQGARARLENLRRDFTSRAASGVTAIAASPDGQRIAVVTGATVQLVDPAAGRLVTDGIAPLPVAALLPRNDHVLVASFSSNRLHLFRVSGGVAHEQVTREIPEDSHQCAAFSADGSTLVIATNKTVEPSTALGGVHIEVLRIEGGGDNPYALTPCGCYTYDLVSCPIEFIHNSFS